MKPIARLENCKDRVHYSVANKAFHCTFGLARREVWIRVTEGLPGEINDQERWQISEQLFQQLES